MTGGAGFIGSAFCRRVALECELAVIDKMTYAASRSALPAQARLIEADIADTDAIAQIFADFAPDAVMHFAAESHVDRSISGPAPFIQTNVVGVYSLLDVTRTYWERAPSNVQRAFRFVHVSTDEVYGALGLTEPPFNETSRYDPRSPYAATKAGGDHLMRAWAHTYGLPVVIANASNNYGPYQFPEKLIPLAIVNALENKPIPVYGDGKQIRDWIHVEDHVDALLRVLEGGGIGETYLIGARCERENLALVEAICDCMGGAARNLITFVEDRPGHDRRYAVDPSKIERELNWRATIAFNEGLARTVQWYCDNQAWWRPIRERQSDSGPIAAATQANT